MTDHPAATTPSPATADDLRDAAGLLRVWREYPPFEETELADRLNALAATLDPDRAATNELRVIDPSGAVVGTLEAFEPQHYATMTCYRLRPSTTEEPQP